MTFRSIIFGRIGRRLLVSIFTLAVIPLVVVTVISVERARREIHKQTLATLTAAADGAEAAVLEFLAYLKNRTRDFSSDGFIRDNLEMLNLQEPASDKIVKELNMHLALNKQPIFSECIETFVLNLEGRVVASSDAAQVGQDHSRLDYFQQGKKSVYVSDVFRKPDTQQITWVVSAPIRSRVSQNLLGVLCNRIDPQALSDVVTGRRVLSLGATTQSMRIGKTGETYIVNRHKLMITESRFLEGVILNQVVDTKPVQLALERGEEMMGDYPDYRGVPISGASIIIDEMGWVLLSEIDFSEAFVPVQQLRDRMIVFVVGLVVMVFLIAWYLTRKIVYPIRLLHEANLALAQGDQAAATIPDEQIPKDEMGQVMRSRNQMLARLTEKQEELEIRIKERTSELRNANEQLRLEIIERKRAEEKFRSLLETAPDAMIITNKNGEIVMINRQAEQLFGYSREELLGQQVEKLIPERFRSSHMEHRAGYIANPKVRPMGKGIELYAKRKDGSEFPVDISLSPLAKEEEFLISSTIRDITERKRAEKALLESKAYAESIIKNFLDTLIVVDTQARIKTVNPETCSLLGYTKEELVGQPIGKIFAEEEEEEEVKGLFQFFRHRDKSRLESQMEIRNFELTYVTKDGRKIPMSFNASLLTDDEGNITGVVAGAKDISDIKRAEEKIKASLKEKEVLLKEIHHRVKNNLQIISSLIDLQSEYIEDRHVLETFNENQNRIQTMALIHEQLYQSKDLARIDFAEYIQKLVDSLFSSYAVNLGAIKHKIDVQDVFLSVRTAIPCGLIINELVSNSLKHAFPACASDAGKACRKRSDFKGEIKISLRRIQNQKLVMSPSTSSGRAPSEPSEIIELIVRDNGVGFPEDLDFRNTESLGLQLVNTLTDQLEGTIELNRNNGTEFKIVFKP